MDARDLLQPLYVASGLLMASGYGPQLWRLLRYPEASALACPVSSWMLWTACRVVALAYCALAVRDTWLVLGVGLDVAGRLLVLALLLWVRWRQWLSAPGSAARACPGTPGCPPGNPRSGC